MNFLTGQKSNLRNGLFLIAAFTLLVGTSAAAPDPQPQSRTANLGIIKGVVRDDGGSPIADATVAIFRLGTTRLLKQVSSASDGSFIAKVLPGTYTVLAVAEGFNPVTLSQVEINASAAMTYGFKLERAGSGNTLPEKRVDRNNPKWVIRSAQTSRSIYQNTDGDAPVEEETAAAVSADPTIADKTSDAAERPRQSVVETYFGSSKNGSYSGVNFATLIPLNDDAEIVLAGQTGTGIAPQRFESQLKFRPNGTHQVRLKGAVGS
ncbi:MAG TPA: carboxypeptidase regulatory-like domain-containing protein, partial [Pyrinomonadaceae bacterium]|nr:carboxypeptidase regulatory-like domain-containing protein [Pyrinomonadaceae bacterium]